MEAIERNKEMNAHLCRLYWANCFPRSCRFLIRVNMEQQSAERMDKRTHNHKGGAHRVMNADYSHSPYIGPPLSDEKVMTVRSYRPRCFNASTTAPTESSK